MSHNEHATPALSVCF